MWQSVKRRYYINNVGTEENINTSGRVGQSQGCNEIKCAIHSDRKNI